MRKPRWYDTFFGEIVREAVKSGDLTFQNIKEWEREFNCGRDPEPDMGTRDIMKYFLQEEEEKIYESVMSPFDDAVGEWYQGGINEYL